MGKCWPIRLFTAQGKVGSRLKVILIGTLAPMAVNAGHWWHDLINDGTKGRTHVQHFKGAISNHGTAGPPYGGPTR